MTRSTSYRLLYFDLSTAPAGLPLGHGSCFSYTPFSGYPYASIPRHMAGPVFGIVIHPRSSNLIPSRVVRCLWVVFVSTSFRASPSVGSHLSAAICNRRIYVMRLAYRELVAVASRRSFFTSSPSSGRLAFFLRWLASFLAANLGL